MVSTVNSNMSNVYPSLHLLYPRYIVASFVILTCMGAILILTSFNTR